MECDYTIAMSFKKQCQASHSISFIWVVYFVIYITFYTNKYHAVGYHKHHKNQKPSLFKDINELEIGFTI